MNFYNPEEEGYSGDEPYEQCEVCHQEYHGVCPISSADCPYAEEEDDLVDLADENLDDLIGDDEEIEKIIEAGAEIPAEDLIDEEPAGEKEEEDITPSKTIEEIEAEELEKARLQKRKKAPAKKTSAKKSAKEPAKKAPVKKAPAKKPPAKKAGKGKRT